MFLSRFFNHPVVRVGYCAGLICSLLFANAPSLGQPHPSFQVTSLSPLTRNFFAMEQGLKQEYEQYFGEGLGEVTQTPADVAQTLARLSKETGSQTGVIWVIPREHQLHLVLVLPNRLPLVRDLNEVPRDLLLKTVKTFQQEISDPSLSSTQLHSAQQLYQWILSPFESDLDQAQVDSLLFCLGSGLRGLPLAALQKDSTYLIEKYALSSIPAFNLIETHYRPLQSGFILAAGASQFKNFSPLPAVPTELATIQSELKQNATSQISPWLGRSLLNQTFTLENLESEFKQHNFNVVHLATHSEFKPGKPKHSFIQFRDQALTLASMDQVNWPENLNLLVLSSCQTALGDSTAELGFAGLALKSRIKSAVGSLWSVSDVGTLALMSEFYHSLGRTPTKAHALQQAQIKLLRGEVHLQEGTLHLTQRTTSLPSSITMGDSIDFSHPYFWAGFTLISSPW